MSRFFASFAFFALLLLLAACSSTQMLKQNEYMLVQNVVKMEDAKGRQFDDLYYLLRPETNKKFMDIFNIRTSLYAHYQAKKEINLDSALRAYPFHNFLYKSMEENMSWHVKNYRRLETWLGEKVGEPPVLLDSAQITGSIEQIKISMKKMGYFDAKTQPEVSFKKTNPKKAKVLYHVTANECYHIREIHYQIDIPEYWRIIIGDTTNCMVKCGQPYNEDLLAQERQRILTLIRDKGYYYVPNEIVTIEIDTFNATTLRDKKGHPTVRLDILVNFDEVKSREIVEKATYKYRFNHVYIYTNYDMRTGRDGPMDTVQFRTLRNRLDTTRYFFITPHTANSGKKIFRDYKYRAITDVIFTKKGYTYAKSDFTRSYNRINALQNFSIINMEAIENHALKDTNSKHGFLDTRYQLTRRKVHGVAMEMSMRTDKSYLSFTYINKNIFKGAEYLSINLYGSVYYYDWLSKVKETQVFGEVGGSVKIDYPHLFLFKQTQKLEALRYSTAIELGANYSWMYGRLMLNANLSYNWSPNAYLSHTFTPISISTIDTSAYTTRTINNYPAEYRDKFRKNMIVSLRYVVNYLVPDLKSKHDLRFSASFESAGMLFTGLNKLANVISGKNETWLIVGYQYATYEMAEFNMRYVYTINKNNSVATHFNIGMAFPLFSSRHLPFERSFFLGGANSMRAWVYRALGPGSFYSQENIQRTGDFKLEMNLEYRGTIYKAVKFGIFADMGNVWLSHKYADMPGAEFNIQRFYKEIAVGVGLGLRFDFNFFLIRLDYGLPLYDPSRPQGYQWFSEACIKQNYWKWGQGFQFAIGHAF
jgi:outer membrane protein assembly factor BamA